MSPLHPRRTGTVAAHSSLHRLHSSAARRAEVRQRVGPPRMPRTAARLVAVHVVITRTVQPLLLQRPLARPLDACVQLVGDCLPARIVELANRARLCPRISFNCFAHLLSCQRAALGACVPQRRGYGLLDALGVLGDKVIPHLAFARNIYELSHQQLGRSVVTHRHHPPAMSHSSVLLAAQTIRAVP